MSFDVSADAYTRFMGRFSEPLADRLVDLVGPVPGQRALDVGCGPGALAGRLVERLGAQAVAAVDPSPSFVSALSAALPGVEVVRAGAERLPFDDAGFDLVAAQLVVHFMTDPVAGVREMARVARPGGTVVASVWDLAGGTGPLAVYERVAHELHPAAPDEADLPGGRAGDLLRIFTEAGLEDLEETTLTVSLVFDDVGDWWEPFTLGVGPAGAFLATLDDAELARFRDRCVELLPPAPFTVSASAWAVTART